MPASEFDRLLGDDYLGDLGERPLDQIRAMRAECQHAEASLSYLRRLVQGRLDIVAADRRRRQGGGGETDLPGLVESLPQILGDKVVAPSGPARPPAAMVVPDDDVTAELDAITGSPSDDLADLDDASADEMAEKLSDLEHRISQKRRALHERLDALQAELARRYASGEASVDSLLK